MKAGHLTYDAGDYVQGTQRDECEIVEKHLPLVKKIISRLRSHCGPAIAIEDMEQIALIALIESARRYPGEINHGFIPFAHQRINGAILDELRRLDWRPRSIRQKSHKFNTAIRDLTKEIGREPTDAEIAEKIGLTLPEYRELLQASHSETIQSLEEIILSGVNFENSENIIEQMMDDEALLNAISQLERREQVILSLYYQHELNLAEIAATLGLSESRICQLHKLTINKLQQLCK